MKACKVCGKELADEETVCDGCGADCAEEVKTEVAADQTAAEAVKKEKGFWAKLPFILNVSAIAVMSVALVCAFLTGLAVQGDGEKANWSFFFLMKNLVKDSYFTLGVAGIINLIHIIVTVAMIALACVRMFVKKKDVFPCFAVVLATTLFSSAVIANNMYFETEEKAIELSVGINGAGIAAVVIVMLYFAVKSLFDIIAAKKNGEGIALKTITAITTLFMCVALMGTSFAIYKRTYSGGDYRQYALGGLFMSDGVTWGDMKGMFKGSGIVNIMCLLMHILSIVLLSVCLLLRNVKERVKGVGRSYVIPALIFYFFSNFSISMSAGSGRKFYLAPTLFVELVLLVVLLALCITERVMQKKQLKKAQAAVQPEVK